MASHRSQKQDSCAHENCGSQRFHIGDDGFTYCDQGHQQSERGTVIAEDTGEMILLGRKSRKKDSDAGSATSRASSFSGSHAFEHYLLCIQLVLRKQLYWLITVQKLPGELESLVKDLFALRLQRVQSRVAYESETETEAPSSQVFSSQSDSEATSASRSTRRSRRKAKERRKEGSPGLVETLALCYTALLYLRIPVTVANIQKWTNDGQLLYHRAAREIPLGMRERLPPRYQAQLEPQDLLPASSIHGAALKLLKTFSEEFGMAPPIPNIPLILYRWLCDLMLPLEVYATTRRLATLLNINFEFVHSTKAGTNSNLRYPEARLMAIIVVSTKLLFPFDDKVRYVRSEADLAATRMDWKEWARQHALRRKKKTDEHLLPFDESFSFCEADCHASSDDKLDAYLDWYEGSIATEDIRERGKAGKEAELRRALFAMFPIRDQTSKTTQTRTGSDDHTSVEERLRKVQSKSRPRQVHDPGSFDEAVRPVGSSYRRFRHASELSGMANALYQRAADLAGLSLDELVQAVFAVERKVQKVEEQLRKRNGG